MFVKSHFSSSRLNGASGTVTICSVPVQELFPHNVILRMFNYVLCYKCYKTRGRNKGSI